MGLLDSLLDVPERLRVWQLAGIQYVYRDPDAAAVASDAEASQDASVPSAAASPSEAAAPDLPAVARDPTAWPAPWPDIFRKMPPTPRLVITYQALGLDMTGHADPRRSALWRRLIQALGLAGANAVAFWPYVLPESVDPHADMAIFLAGMQLLQPAMAAFFGEPPLPASALLRQHVPDLRIVLLADPQTLLDGDTEAWNAAIATLGGS